MKRNKTRRLYINEVVLDLARSCAHTSIYIATTQLQSQLYNSLNTSREGRFMLSEAVFSEVRTVVVEVLLELIVYSKSS